MTDSQLKKLSRQELIELLLKQSRRAEELQRKADKLSMELADKTIKLEQAGSIAEAAMGLNDVFRAAEKAAAQYVESVKRLAQTKERDLARRENELEKMRLQTEQACRLLEEKTLRECEALLAKAKERVDEQGDHHE